MINVTQGNTARFVVQFLSSLGAQISPSSATLVVNFTTNFVSQQVTIALTTNSGFYTGDWDTSSPLADLGVATWSVSSPISPTNPAQSGTINVIDP